MSHINESIKCTVSQCVNHAKTKDYCSLDCITVSTHESRPTENKCTDCMCFRVKKGRAFLPEVRHFPSGFCI